MPIYEFKCEKCHNEFESLVLGSDDDIICPACNDSHVKRLMSSCSFKTGGAYSAPASSSSSGSSACGSCSSKNCSSCH